VQHGVWSWVAMVSTMIISTAHGLELLLSNRNLSPLNLLRCLKSQAALIQGGKFNLRFLDAIWQWELSLPLWTFRSEQTSYGSVSCRGHEG
jgi:hypothetical protein